MYSIGIPELVLILVIAFTEDNTKTIDAKNEDEKKDKK